MSLAERLLMARLKERDPSAFDEIVRRYGDKVFSLIYRMLGNRHEAEDVAQEVFITVFKTVDSFRGEAKFSTWLLRIAANQSKNRIKYLARRPTDGGELDDAAQANVGAPGGRPGRSRTRRSTRRTSCSRRPRWSGSCRRPSPRWTRSTACW